MSPSPDTAEAKIDLIRSRFPAEGLFAEKEWLLSPEAFPLSPKTVQRLEDLGTSLLRFQRASNEIYHRSVKGSLPAWIHDYLDRGKPGGLVKLGRSRDFRFDLPRVIRPDLILTDEGFSLTELDSVPGGLGLTAWLNETYAQVGNNGVVGGASGFLDHFGSVFGKGADIVISEESGDYRPEMNWLASRLDGPEKSWSVRPAESYQPDGRDVYRFFELFDLGNLPAWKALADAAEAGNLDVTAPFKPYLEEKSWMGLFWMRPLWKIWRRELRDSHWRHLQEVIPYTWIVDPTPLPHHAVLPGLEVQSFEEVAEFSQTERELVLKISGFSELGWGSRSVKIGQDLSQEDWAAAVHHAIRSFEHHPYVLQPFKQGKLVEHPYWDEASGSVQTMRGRVRLCPYYFVPGTEASSASAKPRLGGVLATICPADKKILHGMRDAILVPCRFSETGY